MKQAKAKSRIILITGVSRGLGRAMAERFIHLGHTVIGCARSSAGIKALQKKFGAPHSFSVVDVATDRAVKAWADAALETPGAPDLLLNNAAAINANAPLWKVPAREFAAVLGVNVLGTANVLRHFLPAMLERGTGIIVNFSSGWGRSTDANVAPYCATKWAIEGLTQALAQELPPGVAAVSLNPGIINTAMLKSCFGASASSYPDAGAWALGAVPFLLGLRADQNGSQLTAPEPP
jgi:NAD(P)-dependent dehydrogenase (short-subunit alcohol dehydrogenase family)